MDSDYISTKKSRAKYIFVKPDREMTEDERTLDSLNYYYQMCSFPNPRTNKLHMRKFVIDHDNNFINISNYQLSYDQYKKFMKTKRPNEYKQFSTYDLSEINYPTLHDILLLKSDILGTDHSYSGFAPFN